MLRRSEPARARGAGRPASDATGLVTLRHNGRLHHIGIGRAHAGTRVLLLVQDLNIRVINTGIGELLRELILNPDRDYQPTGKRPAGQRDTANHMQVRGVLDVLRYHRERMTGIEPA